MNELINVLKKEEITKLQLRAIYEKYGFKQYKMGRFEEYKFYLDNKNFLLNDSVLTFTNLDGRLLALKPDVTLSIAKQWNGEELKVYYNENVYRPDRNKRHFKEIEQAGLERIGRISAADVSEVVLLAAKSLSIVSGSSLLELGHNGFLKGVLKAAACDKRTSDVLVRLISEKNASELHNVLATLPIDKAVSDVIVRLPGLCGAISDVIDTAKPLCLNNEMSAALMELEALFSSLRTQAGICDLRLDLSLSGEEEYYNGVIFCGYIKGLPARVLSGGRYDGLMEKLGKDCDAIGFAIYFDELEQLYYADKEA